MTRGALDLPDFRLEVHLGRWEFAAEHNLTASDAQTLTIGEVLAMGSDDDRAAFADLGLSYVPTWGTPALRQAVAGTYEHVTADDVLCFAGAQEALFWALQVMVGPGEHAVVTAPNYQSMETMAIATGARVTALPLWHGEGSTLRWALDLDRLRAQLRPETRVVAVNLPNNPTGFIPDPTVFTELVGLCDERGIRLFSDEVYRGLERDPARALPQAADLSERAVSLNVMSKAYGLPGLRIGWIACRDREVLDRLERAKHYTSICNAGPSEFLAALALRNAERIRDRNRAIIAANVPLFDAFFAEYDDLFEWSPPDGGCVTFARYRGADGVEAFCRNLVERHGVVLLPASIYRSELADVPADRFRIGVGRRDPQPALDAVRANLDGRKGAASQRSGQCPAVDAEVSRERAERRGRRGSTQDDHHERRAQRQQQRGHQQRRQPGVRHDPAVARRHARDHQRGEQRRWRQLRDAFHGRRQPPLPEQQWAGRLERVGAGRQQPQDRDRGAHEAVRDAGSGAGRRANRNATGTARPAATMGRPAGRTGTRASAIAAPPTATQRCSGSRSRGHSRARNAAGIVASMPRSSTSVPVPGTSRVPASVERFHDTNTPMPPAR